MDLFLHPYPQFNQYADEFPALKNLHFPLLVEKQKWNEKKSGAVHVSFSSVLRINLEKKRLGDEIKIWM